MKKQYKNRSSALVLSMLLCNIQVVGAACGTGGWPQVNIMLGITNALDRNNTGTAHFVANYKRVHWAGLDYNPLKTATRYVQKYVKG
jgi:hypothetical protein